MATSQARIEANRRNAQKSTGPRTPEGKARSRMNALKHGLSAEWPVMTLAEQERLQDRFISWATHFGARDPGDYQAAREAALASVVLERLRTWLEPVAVGGNMVEDPTYGGRVGRLRLALRYGPQWLDRYKQAIDHLQHLPGHDSCPEPFEAGPPPSFGGTVPAPCGCLIDRPRRNAG